jgi:hypothetical protein
MSRDWLAGSEGDGRSALARLAAVGVLTGVLVLVLAAGALAATGVRVRAGTPFESGPPAVAVDATGTAYVAWANTKDLAGAGNFVQYCVIPAGATACTHSGNLIPGDSAQYVDNVQVLSTGATIVILADVYGASGANGVDAATYEPEQEWQSTDGGATFVLQAGGLSVSSGILSADTQPLGAITVPGTGTLGYGWETAGGAPTFNAFPLTSPPVCSEATNGCPAGFATLEPNTNPDQVTNQGGQLASQLGANPGVIGLFSTDFTNGPLGCSNAQTVPFGTAYAYAGGPQSATNNYNVSPGQPNSAWRVAVTQADCNVEYPAIAGGPSGFGVLEDNDLTKKTVYHRFDPSTMKFDTAMATVSASGEQQPAVAQDGAGGIYATYLNGGSGGPVSLSYSSDGGLTWAGPGTLAANTSTGVANLTSAVNAAGQGWATWIDNGSIYVQQFMAVDAVVPAMIAPGGSTNGQTVTFTISCSSACSITVTVTIGGTISVTSSLPERKQAKPITLGTGKLTLKRQGSKRLKLKLSRAGRKLVAAHHGSLKANILIAEKLKGVTKLTNRSLRIKITAPAKHG